MDEDLELTLKDFVDRVAAYPDLGVEEAARLPGLSVYLDELTALRAENARLKDAARGRGMVSEMADMEEVAVLVCGLHDRLDALRVENARLTAEVKAAEKHIDHIAIWASQSMAGLTNRGVADAVMRMCDDYQLVKARAARLTRADGDGGRIMMIGMY